MDSLSDIDGADENNLLSYDPIEKKKNTSAQPESTLINKIKPNYENLERELVSTQQVQKASSGPVPKAVLGTNVGDDTSLAANVEKIAFNSREIRLVGPQRKPVEMKDDIPSKVVVAFENLQKEAKDVWGDLSVKLEKGWSDVSGQLEKGFGDFKTMVEGVVSKKQQPSGRSV